MKFYFQKIPITDYFFSSFSLKRKVDFWVLLTLMLIGYTAQAQNCTTLYVITGNDDNVYSVNNATGAKTLVTTMTTGKTNLAIVADPASLGTTVFATSEIVSGSTVYKTNASIATTLPGEVRGLTANPATTGATANNVCSATTSNLNRLVTSTTPSGASLVYQFSAYRFS